MNRRYFSFKGRLPRSTYWVYYVLPLNIAGFFLGKSLLGFGMFGWFVLALVTWAGMAGMVKRLHDLDYSASYVVWGIALAGVAGALAGVAPSLGRIVGLAATIWIGGLSFVAYFVQGTKGDNRYGADPLEDL